MARRTLVSALWFASVFLACEVVWSIAATPRFLNSILALSVAAFVFVDPLRQFHSGTQRATATPIVLARQQDAQLISR